MSDRYRVVSPGVASFGIGAWTATEATTTTWRRFVIDFDQAHRRERWVIVDGEG